MEGARKSTGTQTDTDLEGLPGIGDDTDAEGPQRPTTPGYRFRTKNVPGGPPESLPRLDISEQDLQNALKASEARGQTSQ